MSIVLDGSHLTVEKLCQIARDNETVELHPDALERIKACRAMLEKKIQAKEDVMVNYAKKVLKDTGLNLSGGSQSPEPSDLVYVYDERGNRYCCHSWALEGHTLPEAVELELCWRDPEGQID